MVHATNELILGIDLNSDYTQVTYWHPSVREPMTLEANDVGTLSAGSAPASKSNAGQNEEASMQIAPGIRKDANGSWSLWDGMSGSDTGIRFAHVFEKIRRQEPLEGGGMVFEPDEILAAYLELCISGLKLLTENTTLQVMVTVRYLTEALNEVIVQALQRMGVNRGQIYVQDYLSSFYSYAVSQKKELWAQDVALLTWEEEAVVGYVLHIDYSTKPAIARVEEAARQPMGDAVRQDRQEEDWRKEKDRLFFELLKKVFERRQVSASYLMGDYFNKSWAVRSIQFLCTGRRAYQGMNLYSKGACYAALERAGLVPSSGIIYGGRDMVDRNIGMEMTIRGKESFYPLADAGVNWYEVHHVCEFILHGEREIRVISRPMTPGDATVHIMRLPGLPKRPDRATRLRLTLYFSAPSCCHIDVEDLGFGGLYKASGLSWSRDIRF
ncbi:MAG: DUF5716 family protein [Lachnospiraceae bacterium]|nr:DUF5716 family protein [Lachnospiraceae bacterium]